MINLEDKTVILSSSLDPAGRNIRSYLTEHYFKDPIGDFQGKPVLGYKAFALVEIGEELIYLKGLEKIIAPKAWIFASKHSSKAGVHSLTVHTSGNWTDAKFGGQPEEVCVSNPIGMKNCLIAMKEADLAGFSVSIEVTHHGPSDLLKPSFWAEIGSDANAWANKRAGEVVAESILKANSLNWDKVAVGFGGTHYSPAFSRVQLESEFAVGHIMPKHGNFTSKMIKEALEKTPKAKYVILDWKGLGKEQRASVAAVNKSYNFETLRSHSV